VSGPDGNVDTTVPNDDRRRTRRRRLIRIFGVAVGVILTLFVAILIALHTPPAKRWVLDRVRSYLASQQIDFQAESLDYNLLNLSVSLDRIVVRGHDLPDAAPFARIGHVDVNLSLADLLRGSYIVQHAHIVDADLHLFIDEQGRSNLPHFQQSSQTSNSSTIDYLIQQFALTNAHVRYEDLRQHLDATLPISAITITGERPTRLHHLQLKAGGGQVLLQGREADIDRLLADLSFDPDKLTVERLELGAAGSTVSLAATAIKFKDPQYDFSLSARLDLARLAAIAGVNEPVGGIVQADVNLRGPLTAITVRTQLHGDDLTARTLTHIQLAAEANYDAGARQAQLVTLNVTAPAGNVRASGIVSLDPRAGESRLDANIQGLDTLALSQALKLPYSAASKVDGHVNARWPVLEYTNATGDAQLVLRPSRGAAAPGSVPVAGKVDVKARGNVIDANVTQLQALGTTVDGHVSVANPTNQTTPTTRRAIEGAVHARAGDLAAVVAAAETFLGRARGSLAGTPLAGALAVDATLGGTVEAPAVDATVNAPNLSAGTISGVALSADARYTPASVTLSRADVTWQEARVHASGQVGLQGERPIALTMSVEETPIEAALAALGHQDVPATGIVSMQGSVNGTVSHPQAVVTLRGTNLAAYGEALGTLTLDAGLAGRQVEVKQLRLDKPQPGGNGALTARGSYDLDRGVYNVEAKGDNLRLVSVLLPGGTPVRGAIDLNAHGEGTIKDPALTGTFALRDLRVREDDYGNITLNATVANRQAHVQAAADKFNVTANADLATTAPYTGKADIAINDLDLASLPPGLKPETPLAGTVRAHVTASGDVSRPADASAAATIDRLAITWNGQPINTEGPATVRYAEHQVAIDRLVVHAQDSTVSLNGTLPLDPQNREGTINLDAKANLATLAAYAPSSAAVKAQGALALSGTIRGTLRRIDPALTLTVDNASIGAAALKQDLTNVGVKLTIADGALHVPDVHATWGTAQLNATADVPFGWLPENLPVEIPRQTGAAQIRASVTGLDLATLPGAPEKLSGLVSLRADLQAPRPDITSLAGEVTFPDLRVEFNGLTLAQQGVSTIGISGGNVSIERFVLDGTVGHVALSGRVGLIEPRPIDVVAHANIDAAAAAVFTRQVRLAGQTTLELAATGTTAAPNLKGFLELANGRIALTQPQIAAQGLQLRIDFTPERVTLSRLDGNLNGGTLSGSGSVALQGFNPTDVNLNVKANDVGFDQPMNLRSQSSADIHVTQSGDNIIVGGQVTVQEAGLTDDINLDSGIFGYINAPPSLDLTETRNPLLERVRLNLRVKSDTPILVDNNLAKAEIDADLRVVGTPYETGLSGRMELKEGAELTLNERKYTVDRGVITFIDDRRIVPSFDFLLETKARRYNVTIAATGTPDDTQTTLTSDPTLPEPDILALLVTGRTLDEMRGEEFEVARNQVLSYLGGRVGTKLGRTLQHATGLSTVKIEPNLIASEADPSARLTLGQDLTPDLSLVYSTDLVNSSNHIWMTEYDVTRQFVTRGVRQSDGSFRFDFRHDVRFGGEPEPQHAKRKDKQHVGAVNIAFAGPSPVSEEEIRSRLKLKPGDTYDFFTVRQAVRRINALFEQKDRLQERARIERAVHGDTVDLTLRITPGPQVTLVFEGFAPPKDLIEQARTIWHRGVFDTQRADDVRDALKARLVDDRYLDSKIEYAFEGADKTAGQADQAAERRVTFRVEPGVRFDQVTLAFDGARGIDPEDLKGVIKDQKLGPKVFTDPESVTSLLQRLYRERGFLDATLDAPQYEFDHATRQARVVLAVHEGPQYKIRNVLMAGNQVFPAAKLAAEIPSVSGDPYLPASAEQSLTKLRQLYWSKGYNDVRPSYQLAIDRTAGALDLQFNIQEGRRSIVAAIDTLGNRKTSPDLVREQLEIKTGEPLDLAALARSRKNLYDTRAFSLVDISREEAAQAAEAQAIVDAVGNAADAEDASGAQPAPAAQTNPNDVPMRVKVAVREVQPFQIQYGASFDTERGPGGIFNIANHNSLGKAREVGLQTRYDSQVHEARAYMSQPTLRDHPIATIASIYYRMERNPVTSNTEAFNIDRLGVSIQQEKKLHDHYVWSYGYRWERSRTWAPDVAGPLPAFIRVAPLTSTLTRDTRDDVLDATNGSFLSHAFSYSPDWLGADYAYIKYFGQYFRYIALQPPKRKRFTNEMLRPRLVYAGGVRLGLGHGFGNDVPLSERFLAGGSTTLRGFGQNVVGPIGTNGVPLGGEAMLVINNELRFPLIWLFDGVTFVDIGNVYEHANDFSFTDLRKSGGLGLRLRTPWFLVRVDYGVPFDRRQGESKSRVFFSIGQAF
jgi:outer membrane protein assembly factor BamA/autotransporter translocation and assembly factor TamB